MRYFATILILAFIPPALSANTNLVRWKTNHARARGDACSNTDTQFIAAGNDISVIFSRLGIDLSSENTEQIRKNHRCNLSIPITIKRGFRIGRLRQTLTYGFITTDNSEGEVEFKTTFMGRTSGKRKKFGRKLKQQLTEELSEERVHRIPRKHCRNRSRHGLLRSKLKISGKRSSPKDLVLVQIDGLDIRFNVKTTPVRCRSSGKTLS